MKADKRLCDHKTQSAAAKEHWGTSIKSARKMKRQQRKKLRLVNKEIIQTVNPYDLNSVGKHTDKKLRRLIH